MARRVPVRRLNNVDLPTFGRPTITRDGSLSGIRYTHKAPASSSAQSSNLSHRPRSSERAPGPPDALGATGRTLRFASGRPLAPGEPLEPEFPLDAPPRVQRSLSAVLPTVVKRGAGYLVLLAGPPKPFPLAFAEVGIAICDSFVPAPAY